MTLRLNGSTSGYVEIDAPATAGSNTLVLPTGNGTNGQYLQTSGASGVLSWATLPTGLAWTALGDTALSGTSTTISGIPSTAQVVVVSWKDLSDTGGNSLRVRLGTSSSIITANYTTTDGYYGGGSNGAAYARSDAFDFGGAGGSANDYEGRITFTRIANSNERWYGEGTHTYNTAYHFWTHGSVVLGGALNQVQLLLPSGSFDSGSMIVYYLA